MTAWAHAYLAQARSDFAAAQMLLAAPGQASQSTMLLQMAWEKLAKAALANRSGFDPQAKTHRVAERFAGVLRRAPNLEAVFPFSRRAARKRVETLRREVKLLEKLVPALAQGGENTEYPWQAPAVGVVLWPAQHLTRSFCAPRGRGSQLWRDFQTLADGFQRLFEP